MTTSARSSPARSAAASPPQRRVISAAIRVARVTLVVYIVWLVALWFVQDRMLFLPQVAGIGLTEDAIAAEPRIVRRWLAQDDGVETEAWLVRALPTGRTPRGLVVFTHGNAELIDHALHEAEAWTQRGYDMLLPEYRGYGRTHGTPSETRIVADVLAHLDAELAANRARPIVLHGRSLGTGVAAQVAARIAERNDDARTPTPVAALILESPFTSIASFAAGYGAPGFIVRNPFRTDHVLPDLACPILMLHAREDEVVPIAHARALGALQPCAVLVELDGSHNSGLSTDAAYWSAIDRLIGE
jgi:alpha-beta hydrolase superfamily lysophospholipase